MAIFLRKVALSFSLCFALWLGGMVWFVSLIPRTPSSPTTADAIVILTGGAGRIEHGLTLLVEGHGKAALITGVPYGIKLADLLKTLPLPLQDKVSHLPARAIVLDRRAENTIGNAEQTARWIAHEGHRSLLVVTTNYHMPRGLQELREASPQAEFIAAPVFSTDFDLAAVWHDGGSRTLLFSEYHKFLASKFRHLLLTIERRA